MTNHTIFFDDEERLDDARTEVDALILHLRGMALLMGLAADNGQLSEGEAYQMMTGLVHRACRVRAAIAEMEQEMAAQLKAA